MNAKTPAGSIAARSAKAAAAQASGERLLDAAVHVIRSKGYSAARVEDICAEAGSPRARSSKEACAIAAAGRFAANADALFAAQPYRRLPDPRDRVLGYVEFRKAILRANCLSSPASSARWCRRPTTPIPPFAPPATASGRSAMSDGEKIPAVPCRTPPRSSHGEGAGRGGTSPSGTDAAGGPRLSQAPILASSLLQNATRIAAF
jgi:AcrR family transcriptional regulator